MAKVKNIDAYRNTITAVFRQNMLTVASDGRFTPEERVGTAVLCAGSVIGAASAAWQSVNPHLANAPQEAVVRDLLHTLAEILCKPKSPHLHVVEAAKERGNG